MKNNRKSPVFYDPRQRRWKWFSRTSKTIALLFIAILSVFLLSVAINPELPSLHLPSLNSFSNSHPPVASERKVGLLKKFREYYFGRGHLGKDRDYLAVKDARSSSFAAERIGFYVNWDDNSFNSLKHNIAQLDKLMPEWIHLQDSAGAIALDDPHKQQQVLRYLHATRQGLPVIPLINNFDSKTLSWDGAKVAALLANPKARATLNP
jgi:hypothetical protein